MEFDIKPLEDLAISPAPWREWEDDVVDACDDTVVNSYDASYLSGPDANLIAAAPELYDCVYELLEIVGNVPEYIGVDADTLGKISKAKAVLAKVGGAEVE